MQRVGGLDRMAYRFAPVRQFVVGEMSGDTFVHGSPVDELHGVIVNALFASHRIHRNDIGVVKTGGGLGLVAETIDLARIQNRSNGQQFDRDGSLQRNLPGAIDDTHAPAPDQFLETKITEPLFGRRSLVIVDRLGGREPHRDPMQIGQSVDIAAQRFEQFVVFADQALDGRRGAFFHSFQIDLQEFDQPFLLLRGEVAGDRGDAAVGERGNHVVRQLVMGSSGSFPRVESSVSCGMNRPSASEGRWGLEASVVAGLFATIDSTSHLFARRADSLRRTSA